MVHHIYNIMFHWRCEANQNLLDFKKKSSSQNISAAVPFPPSRPQLLASGDASGVVKVWRLNTQLSVQAQGSDEREQLNKIAMETLTTAAL